jgi:predicted membrane protein
MKMDSGLFWGLLLIILGLSLILKVVFHIDFPVVKILVAFFFIYLGIKILFGNFGVSMFKTGPHDVAFGEGNFKEIIQPAKEYHVVFGKGNFDFRNIHLPDSGYVEVKISTVFGGTEILLNSNTPVRVKADAAFAGTQLPNGNSAVFGTVNYESENFDEFKPYLFLKTEAVFGGVDIRRK